MGLRKLIRNTFGFSRSQANGFVLLLPLVTILLFSQPLYRWWVSQRATDFSKERVVLDSLLVAWEKQGQENNRIPTDEEIPLQLFPFDPNSVSGEELDALGFSKNLANRLLQYKAKGGKFRIKADVKKIYGMDSIFYTNLYPYILLPETKESNQPKLIGKNIDKKKTELFDLNVADTTEFKLINGIGSVLSRRIVKYREKLGGFININQLSEVYGLDSAVINSVVKASYIEENFLPKKINLNTVDESVLAGHPYSTKKIARAITAYRFQHGSFQSVQDIRKIELINETVYNRIYPYLTVENKP